ncbi:MAG: hypothetical protein JSR38_19625 [Proteobacteria bacterium]|nr:hypothetical protein [Pseudomonadota bacterium]
MTAAFTLGARAATPAESWWRLGDGAGAPAATLGLAVEGSSFCGIVAEGAAQPRVWVLRGAVVDGRLVEHSRSVLHGAAEAQADEEQADPTDFFLQPTAMVQRERSVQHPRGEFTLFEPLRAAPGTTLWLDMAWQCSAEEAVDRHAAASAADGSPGSRD